MSLANPGPLTSCGADSRGSLGQRDGPRRCALSTGHRPHDRSKPRTLRRGAGRRVPCWRLWAGAGVDLPEGLNTKPGLLSLHVATLSCRLLARWACLTHLPFSAASRACARPASQHLSREGSQRSPGPARPPLGLESHSRTAAPTRFLVPPSFFTCAQKFISRHTPRILEP